MRLQKNYCPKKNNPSLVTTSLTSDEQSKDTLVCQLESISTVQTADGITSLLIVKTYKDGLITLEKHKEDVLEYQVGSLLFVEYTTIKTDSDESNLSINNLQTIPSFYDLSYLNQLFNEAEEVSDLIRLLQFIDRLHDLRIKQLLIELFQDPKVTLPFITMPASHKHHHSYPGGLLSHSIECAEWVESTAYSALETCEAELTLVAALLHDLGKIETMNTHNSRQLVPHETLSLLLVEPVILNMQKKWEQGADTLRAMLSFSISSDKFPNFPGCLLVKMADQFSTSVSARKIAFEDAPDYFYFSKLQTSTSTQFFNRLTVH